MDETDRKSPAHLLLRVSRKLLVKRKYILLQLSFIAVFEIFSRKVLGHFPWKKTEQERNMRTAPLFNEEK